MFNQFILFISILKTVLIKCSVDKSLIEHNILKTIMKDYNKDFHALINSITLDLKLHQIISLDEKTEIFTSDFFFFFKGQMIDCFGIQV